MRGEGGRLLGSGSADGRPELEERAHILAAVQAGYDAAVAGEPAAVLLDGAAGTGKTSLLAAVARSAHAAGAAVLRATCSALEVDFPFAAVRQLLASDPRTRSASSPTSVSGSIDPYAALDALYWPVAALTEDGPVVLLVDDVHWADDPSLRWLNFLLNRLAGVPLLLVLATRPLGPQRPLLAQLVATPLVQRIEVLPLSAAGSARLLRARAQAHLAPELARRCHEAAGGNPFYLTAVARAMGEYGVLQVETALAQAAVPFPEIVSRAVLDRLRALGPDAVAVVRAVAVLGQDADLASVTALAGTSEEQTATAVRAAQDAGLLRPQLPLLAVQHPLVHDIVYGDLTALERTRLHKEAARQLAGAGAEPERVAAHLVATEAGDDIWVVESLLDGARRAVDRGAPETACRYLRRARAEPLAQHAPSVLLELGRAELLAGDLDAAEDLSTALALAADDETVATAANLLSRALVYANRVPEAVDALTDARARLSDPEGELGVRLELEAINAGHLDARTAPRADALLDRYVDWSGERPVDRLVLAHLSLEPARRGTSAQDAVRTAHRALAAGSLFTEYGADAQSPYLPVIALFLSDALEEARRELDLALAQARERSSVVGFCLAAAWRSHVHLRSGDVVAAGADAEAVLAAADSAGLHVLTPYGVAFLSDVLVEQGQLDAADALWRSHGLDGLLPPVLPSNYLLFSRGCLRLAQGRSAQASRDLLESGERQQLWQAPGPGFWPWASRAALALDRQRDHEGARALVQQEVDAARRFGAARPLGMALHAAALLEQGVARVQGLEEARDVLAASPARLEHARACIDLGAALLRVSRQPAGVALLEEGLQLAHACGGTALVTRARSELTAAGVRMRRGGGSGIDALTISERRVAQLAAAGSTNREIAQALFVTTKTVETHLARAFRKLGVASRRELPEVLEGASP